jgi:hypothetical protein
VVATLSPLHHRLQLRPALLVRGVARRALLPR